METENLGYEHSVLTSGELLENGIASRGVRRTYEGASPESQMFSGNRIPGTGRREGPLVMRFLLFLQGYCLYL